MGKLPRFASLLLLLPVASCIWLDGGDDTGDVEDCLLGAPTPEAPFTQTEAFVLGSALRMVATRAAWAFEPPALGWTTGGGVTVGGTDGDGDGWPDGASTVTLDSAARPAFGGVELANGSYTIDDLSDAVASFAHTATGTLTLSEPGLAASTLVFTHTGAQAAGYASLELDEAATYAMNEFVIDTVLDATATFTSSSGNWTAGTALADGDFTLAGSWTAQTIANIQPLEIFDATLTLDDACEERIVSGFLSAEYVVTGGDGGDCSGPAEEHWLLTVEWTGCGATTFTHHETF